MGRHSEFTTEVAERFCYEISNGATIERLCNLDEWPSKPTIFKWLKEQETFANEYARARENRADARAERIDQYVQEVRDGKLDANSARVIIDAEKWQAGKEKPKIYGDSQLLKHGDADGKPLHIVVTGVRPTEENT